MSDNPYTGAKAGRLCFKGGVLASRSSGVDKKSKKKKKEKKQQEEIGEQQIEGEAPPSGDGSGAEGEAIYTIDAAKKMKYEDIFPVETRKFGYEPKVNKSNKSVEDALDDRVKKKADRYCK